VDDKKNPVWTGTCQTFPSGTVSATAKRALKISRAEGNDMKIWDYPKDRKLQRYQWFAAFTLNRSSGSDNYHHEAKTQKMPLILMPQHQNQQKSSAAILTVTLALTPYILF